MLRTRALLGSAIVWAGVLSAQTPPEAGPAPARAVQLPLSGRTGQPGGVGTVQNPLPGGLQSVNTITSTVQVQGAYQGSVLSGAATGQPITTYTTFISGPAPGHELHVVLIDNGRSAILAREAFRRSLTCMPPLTLSQALDWLSRPYNFPPAKVQ